MLRYALHWALCPVDAFDREVLVIDRELPREKGTVHAGTGVAL